MKRGRQSLSLACLALLAVFGVSDTFSKQYAEDTQATLAFASEDPYQVLFLIGLAQAEKGDYTSAISIFRSLFRSTRTRRVQLELARALFLDRQYKESKRLFLEVFENPNVPLSVRENIKLYLDEADAALGQLKFSFEIVADSNPAGFTDARKVTIAGQTLRIEDPPENDTVLGIKYDLAATKALTEDASITSYLKATFVDYEGGQFDRWRTDLGLSLAPRSTPRFRARMGYEQAVFDGSQLYAFPYATLIFIPDPLNQFRLNTELQYGQLDVKTADYLSAHRFIGNVNAKRQFSRDSWVAANVFVEHDDAKEDAYSYWGGGIGAELSIPMNDYWGAKLFGSLALRDYEDHDPLFGSSRRDQAYTAGISFFSRLMEILGREPEIGFRYEKRDSNQAFFEFDRVELIFRLSER